MAKNENILGDLNNKPQPPAKSIKTISFTKNICFDDNLRYLACYGSDSLMILHVEQNKSWQYQINLGIYDELNCMRLKSSSDDTYECHIACKKRGINQIVVFDYSEYMQKLNAPNNKKSAWYVD